MLAKFSSVGPETTVSKLSKGKRKFLCSVHVLLKAGVKKSGTCKVVVLVL